MIPNLYKTKRWQAVRKQALERDGYRCRSCYRRGRLHVHHNVPIPRGGKITNPVIAEEIGYNLKNLVSLCRYCHNDVHSRQGPIEAKMFREYVSKLLKEKENDEVAKTPSRTERAKREGRLITC